jgi:transcriptional regulator of arginine metabolism
MHAEKTRRHQVIIEIVGQEPVGSQEELREKLSQSGFSVTQATLSRDLRELGVVKRASGRGDYEYALPAPFAGLPIQSCRSSGNLLVMRTEVGSAPRVAYRIDALRWPEILGTVAGEDTLLIVIDDQHDPDEVAEKIWKSLAG